MKLRNKKTGEIGNLVLNINPNRESYSVLSTENGDTVCGNLVLADYDSLVELNEEWEDYEEPKEYWFIDYDGGIIPFDRRKETATDRLMKSIGNHFETKEEAEKAVEKLKAWKRLKDKGFRFTNYDVAEPVGDGEFCGQAFFRGGNYSRAGIRADLDLLFGGEE